MKAKYSLLLPILFSLVITAALLFVALVFDLYKHPLIMKEGGVIETFSAAGYFVCALLMLLAGRWSYVRRYNYFLILVVMFGMRELDFDKRFTTMGILKSRFFFNEDVPFIEKFFGGIAIAVLIYAVLAILKNHLKGLLGGVKRLSPVHVGAVATFCLLGVAKSVDGAARKLADIGIVISSNASDTYSVIEEVLEFGIPLVIFSTLTIYFFTMSAEDRVSRPGALGSR